MASNPAQGPGGLQGLATRWNDLAKPWRVNVALYALTALSLVALVFELVAGDDTAPTVDLASQVPVATTTSTVAPSTTRPDDDHVHLADDHHHRPRHRHHPAPGRHHRARRDDTDDTVTGHDQYHRRPRHHDADRRPRPPPRTDGSTTTDHRRRRPRRPPRRRPVGRSPPPRPHRRSLASENLPMGMNPDDFWYQQPDCGYDDDHARRGGSSGPAGR